MSGRSLKIVILGLTITSSWGNGHATTFRGLVRELDALGHDVLFLERDVPWYARNRDLPNPPYGRICLYASLDALKEGYAEDIRGADFVMVGSYVPDGVAVGEWVTQTARGVTAFYDIDTPVTLAKLAAGDYEYLTPVLIPRYGLYLSFTGGPTLERLEREYGSPRALPLYCSFDPALYFPEPRETLWDLGYMGTYSDDRQPALEKLLIAPARHLAERRFVVAGPQYPETIVWPENVERIAHLPPAEHRAFYNAQRFTLNITRADMIAAGYSPSVRLFEAAACATPIVSDDWDGLDTFFRPGDEILIACGAADVEGYLRDISDEERHRIGESARARVLAGHTAAHRAATLVTYIREAMMAAS
jgi:spore maturation protein CgeB